VGAMKHQCQVLPEDLGPYLLGQLEPDEEARIAALVADCPSCTAEVRALRPVVAALALSGDSADPTPHAATGPPPAGLDGVLSTVHRERARRRSRSWRIAAAAAVVVLALGLGAVTVLVRDGGDDGRRVTLSGQGTARGGAVVAERAWGTAITLTVTGLQPGRPYGAWLENRSGDRVPAGTFTATTDGTMRLDLSALMRLDDAAAVGVTQLDGKDVLRHDF
jgi:anti-sigma-K factor RskA